MLTTAPTDNPVCRGYFPASDDVFSPGACSSCRRPEADHLTRPVPPLLEVAASIEHLLSHYGHNCTVQMLLPELRAALRTAGAATSVPYLDAPSRLDRYRSRHTIHDVDGVCSVDGLPLHPRKGGKVHNPDAVKALVALAGGISMPADRRAAYVRTIGVR